MSHGVTIRRDSGHIYTLEQDGKTFGPYPGVTRIAALQDSLMGADGLVNWSVGLALDEVERQMKTPAPGTTLDDIRKAAFAAKDVPRNVGSAVHAAIDHINRRRPLFYAENGTARHVAQYAAAVVKHGIVPLGSELYVVNTTVGFGGTLDFYGLVDGQVALVDIKSGKAKDSQRLQLAGLSMGEWIGDEGAEALPMPTIEAAYILLLQPDSYELIPHHITDQDREHFADLVKTYHQIRGWSEAVKG